LFAKSIAPGVGFLQIASTPALLQESVSAPSVRAYNIVKAQAKRAHSVRFAALAVKIRTSKSGHFDGVIKDIDLMLKTLAEEGAADLDKKNQCLEENQKIDQTVNDVDWQIKNNDAKINKLEKLIELRTQDKAAANDKIKETNQYIKDITADRKAEHEAFLQAKKDDEAAVDVLTQAKEAMEAFYKKNGIEMGPSEGLRFLQEPEFARSEDDAPDASFTKKGSNKNASKNILSLMEYIIEDLNDEIANGKKTEATSLTEFVEEKTTAETLVSDLEAKVVTLKGIISKRNDDKKDEHKDMKENNKDRDSELGYQAKIKPDCDWIYKAFDGRAEARAAEANGLTQAKEFLSGRTALLQKSKSTFDDGKLSSLGFLGIAH